MALPALTNENVWTLLKELRTNEDDRNEAITKCREDLVKYLKEKFEFTSDQENYLKNVTKHSPQFLKVGGFVIALALEENIHLEMNIGALDPSAGGGVVPEGVRWGANADVAAQDGQVTAHVGCWVAYP